MQEETVVPVVEQTLSNNQVLLAMIATLGTLLTTIIATITTIILAKINKMETKVDGRLTQLLAQTQKTATAEASLANAEGQAAGLIAGKQLEKDEAAVRAEVVVTVPTTPTASTAPVLPEQIK